jgi:AcrR family transcriptional regulator
MPKKSKVVQSVSPLEDGRNSIRHRNRERLLQAAEQLFREVGYEAVSTREIIAASGLGLGTFYNHFRSKEDLFRVLIDERALTNIAAQRRYRNQAGTLREFFDRHFTVFFDMVCEDPAITDLFKRNVVAIREVLSTPHILESQQELEQDIKQMIKKGWIDQVDPKLVAAAMTGVGIEVGALVARQPASKRNAAIRLATELFARGLSAKTL